MARRDIDRLQGEIEELFADLWQIPRFAGLRHGFRPQVDCFRTSEPPELTIVIELPGVDADGVRLVAAEGGIVVSGERLRPRRAGQVYQQMEIEYGAFERKIPLAEEVDVSRAAATYRHGMLTIVLPISASQPSGPVEISVRNEP